MRTFIVVTREDVEAILDNCLVRVGNAESPTYLCLDEKYKELIEEDVNNAED